jgi:uncharacterized Zn-finger protein
MAKHTGANLFMCEVEGCEVTFKTLLQRSNHQLTVHEGKKIEFPCDWPGCDAIFSRKDNMKIHLLNHKGEKNYACDFPGCDYRDVTQSIVDRHRRKKHKVEMRLE